MQPPQIVQTARRGRVINKTALSAETFLGPCCCKSPKPSPWKYPLPNFGLYLWGSSTQPKSAQGSWQYFTYRVTEHNWQAVLNCPHLWDSSTQPKWAQGTWLYISNCPHHRLPISASLSWNTRCHPLQKLRLRPTHRIRCSRSAFLLSFHELICQKYGFITAQENSTPLPDRWTYKGESFLIQGQGLFFSSFVITKKFSMTA